MGNLIKLDWGDCKMSFQDIADKMNLSYSAVYAMYEKGCYHEEEFLQYRIDLAAGKKHKYSNPVVVNSSRGRMTYEEIEQNHEHGVPRQNIRWRVLKWGETHKSIWLPRLARNEFIEEAIKLDGPPRGIMSDNYIEVQQEDSRIHDHYKPKTKLNFDRTKCCFKRFDKCKHYSSLINREDASNYPEPCKQAKGDSCSSYSCESYSSQFERASNNQLKSFKPNGTCS